MTVHAVYSSDQPDVLGWWSDTQARYRDFHAACDGLVAPVDGAKLTLMTRSGGGRWAHGWDLPGVRRDRPDPPSGWRYDRDGYLVPDKRTRAGKTAAASLPRFAPGKTPGMPSLAIAASVLMSPSIELLDGVMWAGWSAEVDDQVDLDVWSTARMSAYWMAKEAAA